MGQTWSQGPREVPHSPATEADALAGQYCGLPPAAADEVCLFVLAELEIATLLVWTDRTDQYPFAADAMMHGARYGTGPAVIRLIVRNGQYALLTQKPDAPDPLGLVSRGLPLCTMTVIKDPRRTALAAPGPSGIAPAASGPGLPAIDMMTATISAAYSDAALTDPVRMAAAQRDSLPVEDETDEVMTAEERAASRMVNLVEDTLAEGVEAKAPTGGARATASRSTSTVAMAAPKAAPAKTKTTASTGATKPTPGGHRRGGRPTASDLTPRKAMSEGETGNRAESFDSGASSAEDSDKRRRTQNAELQKKRRRREAPQDVRTTRSSSKAGSTSAGTQRSSEDESGEDLTAEVDASATAMRRSLNLVTPSKTSEDAGATKRQQQSAQKKNKTGGKQATAQQQVDAWFGVKDRRSRGSTVTAGEKTSSCAGAAPRGGSAQ